MTPSQPNGAAPEPQQESTELVAITPVLVERQQRLRLDKELFDFRQRQANLFVASGLFQIRDTPAAQAVAQAVVKMELGASMGFSDAESLQGIYIINGQTAISSALRAARMQAAGYGWDIQWHGSEQECSGVTLWMKYKGQPMMQPVRDAQGQVVIDKGAGAGGGDFPRMEQVRVSFLRKDAESLLTTMAGKRVSVLEKDNWKGTPRNMFFARAITNAQRFHAPACLSANLLSVEEAEDLEAPDPKAFGVFPVTASADTASLPATVQRETLKDRLVKATGVELFGQPDATLYNPAQSYDAAIANYSSAPKHIARLLNLIAQHGDATWEALQRHGITSENFGTITKERAEIVFAEVGKK